MSLTGNASTDNLLIGNVKGLNSIHGKSAYELAVIHGFEGTEEEWVDYIESNSYVLTEEEKDDVANRVKEIMGFSVVTPELFGAVGDGVTDDTQAFKNTINYAKTERIPITLNHGVYKISSTIELPLYVKLQTMGDVTIKYVGEGSLFHIYNTHEIIDIVNENTRHNAFNIGNVLDGSRGVLILKGQGVDSNQIGIELGETTLGLEHISHSAWCNFANVYIEGFSKGIFFTNVQNYIQRFYNITIGYCGVAISNSDLFPENSGELITFDKCSINNNNLGVQVNHIINLNFVNCSIDYNSNGIELNWQGYYTLNLDNCWLEGNNQQLVTDSYLIKSNVPTVEGSYNPPIVNITNCNIYPTRKIAWKTIKGKMFLNITNCTIHANLYDSNYANGEFLCDSDVIINSENPSSFIDNVMLLSEKSIINKNWDLSDGLSGYDFTANQYGANYELATDVFYTGSKSIKVAGSSGNYIDFSTTKFSVSRIKKLLGNILLYIDSDISQRINTEVKFHFYDKDGTELSDELIVLNKTYTYEKTKDFVLIPGALSENNSYINVPNEAVYCSLQIIFGALNSTIYIDNIAITGI